MNTSIKERSVIIIRGISGSGKSTLASRFKKHVPMTNVISSDAIRAELGDVADQSKNSEVFAIFKKKYINAMSNNELVVLDATNVHYDRVIEYIDLAYQRIYNVMVVTLEIDVADAIARVHERSNKGGLFVPDFVVEKQYVDLNKSTNMLIDLVDSNENHYDFKHIVYSA